MNGNLYLVSIGATAHPMVIRETVNKDGQAEWSLIRNATTEDLLNVPKHPYFTRMISL